MLLESFYRLLDVVNKYVANNIAEGSPMNHTYEKANVMLGRMTKTNTAWHTIEDKVVSRSTREFSKEEMLINEAKEERMAQLMN